MKLSDVIDLLNAEVLFSNDEKLNMEIKQASASDLMSDVLASKDVPDILLTGLTNTQVIRTSSISGIKAIVIVRDKSLESKVIELAKEEGISLITTHLSLFESCGKLYEKGIKGVKLTD